MFTEGAKSSDSGEGSDYRLPPPGLDLKAMERALKMAVKSGFHSLVKEDDSEGLEEALEKERSANPKPPSKKSSKKKSGSNGTKEEDEFAILGRKLLHYASALDAVDCCKLLVTAQNLPRIGVDAIDETDQRSALHIASLHHSKRCIEVLLKQGANVNLKNKQLAVPLEEALLSIKMHVDWDFSTPAAQIVEKVREKDLAALRSLEPKCKDLLIPVAFKLAKTLKLVPLVALLIVSRSSFVVNSVAKKVEGEEDSVGTLVDLLLGKALTCSSVCTLDKIGARPKKAYPDGLVEGWPDVTRSLRTPYDGDGSLLDPMFKRSTWDLEASFEPKFKRVMSDWEDRLSEKIYRKDMSEWEEINFKYRSNGCEGESSTSDGRFRRSGSGGDMDKRGARIAEDKCSAAAGEDVEANCKIARKLLECVLLFSPRLSAHPQSPSLPPLLRAAQANDEVLLSLLLEAGAPINETDSDGNTALHWVLRQATPVNKRSVNRKLVKRLLDAGANVLLGNKLGATPVHTSAGHGHFEALQLILEKEARGVNVMAATKETPLHYSVKNNHILCTALLLTHGANRNVSSLRSQKPFQLAPSPEMRALLSLDEGTLRELPSDILLETLAVLAQQQGTFQCVDTPSGSLPPTFAQAAAQSVPGHHLKSQFQVSQASSFSGTQPLSFSQSLSMPALSESFTTSQAICKSSPSSCQPPLSLRSQSLPASHEVAAWNSPWLALQKAVASKQPSNGVDLSQICEGESSSSKSSVNLPAYKTVLCRFYGTSDGCGWGTKCHFAHSEEELRVGQQNLKTLAERGDGELCSKTFQMMADSSDQSAKNFKTKLCMHHEKLGTCPHGGKCKFAHGEGELRPLSASSSLNVITRVGMRPSTASSLASNESEEGVDASSRKVFVGGLPHFINSDELWEFFESDFGKVVDAVVICGNDEEGNARSRGFGFVLFEQQKDADEAVKKHYLPFRGKKVEVKRAMARVDSPSGDETIKMASSFSSGISSPAAPESPAMPPSLSGVSLFNDGMQLPASPALGTTPGWSMLSVSGDNSQEGMQSPYLPPHNRTQHVPPPPTSMPYLSEQQKYPHVNAGPVQPQNSNKPYLQENALSFPHSEPYPPLNAHTGQNPMQQPGGQNSGPPQVEPSSVASPKPYGEPSAYSDYNPSSSNPPRTPSLPSVSNGTGSQNRNPSLSFSYYDTTGQAYFNSTHSHAQPPPPLTRSISATQPRPPTQPPPSIRSTPLTQSAPSLPITQSVPPLQPSPLQGVESNQREEDDELSQLIDLLNGSATPPSSSTTSQAYPQTYHSQPSGSSFSSQGPPPTRGMHLVLAAENGVQETRTIYSRDPPPHLPLYSGRSSFLQANYYGLSSSQLPDGFREVPQTPPTNYKEMSQSSNSCAHPLSHPGAPIVYNPHLPVGSKLPSDGQAANLADATAPRGAVFTGGAASSTVMNALLPGYGNSHSEGSHMYSSAPYGGFEVTR